MTPSHRPLLAVLLAGAVASGAATSQPVVDGMFDEWGAPLYSDATGDGGPVDFGRLWGAADEAYLYLAFETGAEIGLQDGNAITLYVDADDDPTTGEAVAGIGAEVRYAFAPRSGTATLPGHAPVPIDYRTLGLFSAPTVTSDRFEVAIRRDTTVGGVPLFSGQAVRVVLVDGGGDALPDAPGGVRIDGTSEPPVRPEVGLGRRAADDLRVLSYNVLRDRLFEDAFAPRFGRLLRAIDPDVVALQEVYAHSADEAAARLGDLLPGTTWYGAGAPGVDVHVISRYPVVEAVPLCATGRPSTCNVAALLDLGDGARLYVVSMHPPCCENDAGRQEDFDLLASHLRDARASGALAPETPVVVAGDMNLVGDRRQLETLLTGAIVDTGRFGPGAPPDADGTALTDAAPRTTGRPADFTWIDDGSTFPPGRLDYVVYSDALLEARNGFVLYTPGLTGDELARYGLEAEDSAASDHLPVVQDFAFRAATGAEGPPEGGAVLGLPAPNPARAHVSVRYRLGRPASVRLTLLDALGRTVRLLEAGPRGAGDHATGLDVGGLAPGVYVLRLDGAGPAAVRRLVVVE